MEQILTIGTIEFLFAVVGFLIMLVSTCLGVYKYVRGSSEKSTLDIALLDQRDGFTMKMLADRLEASQQGTDRRFKDMQEAFALLVTNNQNHLHTVDSKVDNLNTTVTGMGKEMVRMATLLDERLPGKKS